MKLEYLRQAAAILDKCGRPQLPGGISAVPLTHGFIMPMALPAGGTSVYTKEITGNAPWVLRAISSDQGSASMSNPQVIMQIQLPNGRFLFGNDGVDIGQFAWMGSWRWLQTPELRCEPGSKIQVSLINPVPSPGGEAGQPLNPGAINLYFEGANLLFIKGGEQIPYPEVASLLPRYQGIVNENILAPAWMSNEGIATPAGFSDEYFVYSTVDPADQPVATTWTVGQIGTASVVTVTPTPVPFEIQIDPGYTMFIRRILFDVQFTGDVTAIVLAKMRTGAGYVLNDNFINFAQHINGSEYAGNWKVKGGDSVFIDANLGDITGTAGTVTLQVFIEGYRRRER